MTFHPATRLLMWLAFAVFLPWLSFSALLCASLVLAVLLVRGNRSPFVRQIRRTRWLLLSIFLVYALATPGTELSPALGAFSPTSEGLHAGALQAWRLAILLGALALLLTATPGKEMLAGLYYLLAPLGDAAAGQVATRIWLTLYYAEQTLHLTRREWRDKLRSALDARAANDLHTVSFATQAPAHLDWAALAATILVLGGLAL